MPSVVTDPDAVVAETERVLAPDGRVSVYDKFPPEGKSPGLVRRAFNPLARVLFSDPTRQLGPMLDGTGLDVIKREWVLGALLGGRRRSGRWLIRLDVAFSRSAVLLVKGE